jgi:uncharacterized BrkB/YihY/UPF0761 family membrane protein
MNVFTSKQVLRLKINRAMGMLHANSLPELLSRKAAVTTIMMMMTIFPMAMMALAIMTLARMACSVATGSVPRVP